MKKLILAMALLGASLAQAQTSVSKIDQISADFNKCGETAQSTYDMNMCADLAYKSADAELNRFYKATTASLMKSKSPDDKEMLSRLVKSERAWVPFRDANCSLQGIEMLGGSGEGPVVGGCLVSETIKRVKELRDLFSTSK